MSKRAELNSPCTVPVAVPSMTTWSLTRCNSAAPAPPRSSTTSFRPPVVPRPSIGGAPKARTDAPRTAVRQRASRSRATASPVSPGRSENGFNITYIDPRFGAFAPSTSDCPEMPTVCATPGVSSAARSMRAINRPVRSTDAESGSCTLSSRYPLSCCGTNPVGVRTNSKYVSASKPA